MHHVHTIRQLARFQVARGSDGGVQHLAQPGTQQRQQTGQVDEEFPHQPSPSCRRQPNLSNSSVSTGPRILQEEFSRAADGPPASPSLPTVFGGARNRESPNSGEQDVATAVASLDHQFPTAGIARPVSCRHALVNT